MDDSGWLYGESTQDFGFAPYEFVGGDSVGLVFYPGTARRGSDHEAYVLNLIFTQVRSSRRPRTPRSAGASPRKPKQR